MPTAATLISSEHPNAVSYRRTADAFRAGDLDTLATTIDEDVIWHLPGTSWMARDFEGRAALLEYLREIMVRTNGTFKLQDVCVSGSDDHVLAVQRFGATVDGEEQLFNVSSVMRFSDGLQKERWFHIHDLNAFDGTVLRQDVDRGWSFRPVLRARPWSRAHLPVATPVLTVPG